RGSGADSIEDDVDHYAVLGLPSGEEALKLTLKEIEKAYRNQSRIRHPDKRPDDPNATADFQRLTSSFEILKDEAKRSAFDATIRARIEKIARDSLLGAKRRKLASDLDERERAAARDAESVDPDELVRKKEKTMAAELKRELQEFQARKVKKATDAFASASGQQKGEDDRAVSLDKERVLKVSWERTVGDYSAVKLREIFETFGKVEDVVIRSKGSKKKGSAIVVMSSKEATVAATHAMSGSISNPLLVLPLQPANSNISSTFSMSSSEAIDPKLSNIIGAGFQDYEASILKKLEKANEMRKRTQQ
ncbi:dnaJ homolog subfamily C member 17, partial [Asparagus officinalis]